MTFKDLPADYGVGYAGCIGHGAMSENPSKTAVGSGEWEFAETVGPDADGDTWRSCSLAVVDLATGGATVRYVDHGGRLGKDPDHFSTASAPSLDAPRP